MNYHKNMLPLNTLSRVNRLTLLSLYFGEEKGIKTEVGEVHEASKKNRDNVDKQVYPQGFISADRG